ncbi:MAG: YidB family protein [Ramlibacter sp.]
MASDLLGQILGSVLRGGSAQSGGLGGLGGLGGGLGDVLGNMMGRGSAQQDARAGQASPFGGKGALIAMLLPIAMQWVQRNGGVGAVLDRFRQKGYSQQAASWISTGDNQELTPHEVGDVVGLDELSRLSQQLGVPQGDVASGLAQIFPEVVNQLTPSGEVPDDADDVLGSGLSALEQLLGRSR